MGERKSKDDAGRGFWTAVPRGVAAMARFDGVIDAWHEDEPPLVWPPPQAAAAGGVAGLVRHLGLVNCFQWHLEDACRASYDDIPVIAQLKYDIDESNGRRVRTIDAINERFLAAWRGLGLAPDGLPVALDTPGGVYDRLSILALKRYHHTAPDVQARLAEQIADLCLGLDSLLADLAAGRVRFRVYRSFKLYGDS